MAVETPIAAWSDILGAPATVGAATFTLGTKFSPSVSGQITGLGCRRPQAGTRTVKVWDATSQALLGSASIVIPGGVGWTYATLGTPIVLTAGGVYIVSTFATSLSYYRYTGMTFPNVQSSINIVEGRFLSTDAFPTSVGTTSFYAMSDVQFTPDGGLGGSWGNLELV